MSGYLLQMEHIAKSYQDGTDKNVVLNDISLNVKGGEFIAIVGPSGSGKSTFLTIAGMLLSPDSGSVLIAGKNVSAAKKREWAKIRQNYIGFIFQNNQLLPYLKAKEQLTAFQTKDNRGRINIDEMLSELDVEKCKNQYPAKMSGGEKQRIAIAKAFVNDPDIILADEPTASLDGARGHQVVEMIRMEVKKHDKAAVMVTHDERVLHLADQVYHLENGKLTQ
ncbi:MAG: ABC transporter ATP-binding protein [Lachnospiraceae bacterium]|nr:ABC transporter ATP-binding protein [Lachnospiraceae bacterium]